MKVSFEVIYSVVKTGRRAVSVRQLNKLKCSFRAVADGSGRAVTVTANHFAVILIEPMFINNQQSTGLFVWQLENGIKTSVNKSYKHTQFAP